MNDLRLTFCQQAPYVIWDSDISTYRGAWLDIVNELSKDRNWTTSYVVPPESACLDDMQTAMVDILEKNEADVAVHPFIYNLTYSETVELVSAYPVDVGSPIFISERQTSTVSVFSDPFTSSAWKLIGIIVSLAILTTVIIDRHGNRSRHIPRVILSVFNSVDLPDKCRPSVYLLYCWISLLSLLFFTIYTSIMAEILLINTNKIDTFAKASADNVTISITRDIVKQLKLSNSPFSLILDTNYNVVDTEDAIDNLPVLVSWPVSSMMRQLSCKDLDSAYREVSKIGNSMLMRADAPDWIYGDVKDAVFDRRYPKAVQSFIVDHPFCAEKEAYTRPELRYVTPILVFGAVSIVVSWLCHFIFTRYESQIENLNEKLSVKQMDVTRSLKRMGSSIRRTMTKHDSVDVPVATIDE